MNKNSSRNSYHHPLKTYYRGDPPLKTLQRRTKPRPISCLLGSPWPKRALLTGSGLAPWVFTPGTRMRPARRRTTYLPLLLGWAPRLPCLFTLQQSIRHPPSIRASYIRKEGRGRAIPSILDRDRSWNFNEGSQPNRVELILIVLLYGMNNISRWKIAFNDRCSILFLSFLNLHNSTDR